MAKKIINDIESHASDASSDGASCELNREGGTKAWLTVVGSILVYYASFGIMNSFGFFQNFYTNEFLKNTPASSIAFIGTLQMALMNSLAAVSGALCDRYGVKYLYLGSGTGTIAALLMLSFARPEQFWQVFLTQGLLLGIMIAFGVQPALTVVGQHFKERRALAMGLVSTGCALGGIGFPLMFERLLPTVGFANALRLAALKIAICYAIALYVSTSLPSGKSDQRKCSSLLDFKGFLDLRYAILCVGTWFSILGLWITPYYIKSYANAAYPENTISQYFLCMLNGCSIFGAVFGGLLGDRIGRLNFLWPITLFSGCLCLLLWLHNYSITILILFVCLYGFTTSSVSCLPPSVIGQFTPDDRLGARIGAFYSIVAVASLIGSPIGGALITDAGEKEGYRWLILFSGTSLILGSFIMLGSRLVHDKNLQTKW